jgi:hypothetical protein
VRRVLGHPKDGKGYVNADAYRRPTFARPGDDLREFFRLKGWPAWKIEERVATEMESRYAAGAAGP